MRPAICVQHKSAQAKVWHVDANELLSDFEPSSVDLIVSSPPYCIGKEYDTSTLSEDFSSQHAKLLPLLVNALKPGGSLCWQIGNHVKAGKLIPLDALVYLEATKIPDLVLRNRIVWTFNHGVHCTNRFSGRHETILWFTKGDDFCFDLDSVRIPQKYPGKKHYKGPRKGQWSGNPLGKNPGDVWDIPNVKAKHVEKTAHPCQFPSALVRRLVRALTKPGQVVMDPFLGSGTTAMVALEEQRDFLGCEIEKKYLRIIERRLRGVANGLAQTRPDVAIRQPNFKEAVAVLPPHFAQHRTTHGEDRISER
jgi:adenine-specific DNA-methyltransferase